MFYLIESSDRRNDVLYALISKNNFAQRFLPGSDLNALICGKQDNDKNKISGANIFGTAAIIFSPLKELDPIVAEGLPNESLVFGGEASGQITEILDKKQIRYIDLNKNEIYAIKNAVLSAEGALAAMLSASEKSVFKANILIIGCGGVGKAIAVLLGRLGVDAAIATFCAGEYETSGLYAERCFLEYEFLEHLNSFDIIINTYKKTIFDAGVIEKIKNDAVILELCKCSCLNKEDYKSGGFMQVFCPDAAARYSPFSAAELMLECIYQEISNK